MKDCNELVEENNTIVIFIRLTLNYCYNLKTVVFDDFSKAHTIRMQGRRIYERGSDNEANSYRNKNGCCCASLGYGG